MKGTQLNKQDKNITLILLNLFIVENDLIFYISYILTVFHHISPFLTLKNIFTFRLAYKYIYIYSKIK